jgi:hypothetical protein
MTMHDDDDDDEEGRQKWLRRPARSIELMRSIYRVLIIEIPIPVPKPTWALFNVCLQDNACSKFSDNIYNLNVSDY